MQQNGAGQMRAAVRAKLFLCKGLKERCIWLTLFFPTSAEPSGFRIRGFDAACFAYRFSHRQVCLPGACHAPPAPARWFMSSPPTAAWFMPHSFLKSI
jgi:hypothetical protein